MILTSTPYSFTAFEPALFVTLHLIKRKVLAENAKILPFLRV